eukprot:TRINITY_DN10888_c0_g1_i1.p1 TRINITY_DN10888_c0_g1~~TRINITY_DN10888_c0_g1_i1.p1  ORF type:complete len:557 (+),score=105.56 TRINITY_DN10888_c0_g1_i1:67-1671(+)
MDITRQEAEALTTQRQDRLTERMHLLSNPINITMDNQGRGQRGDDIEEDSQAYSALQPRIDPLKGDLIGKDEFFMRRSGKPDHETQMQWEKASSSSLLCTQYRLGHGKAANHDISGLLSERSGPSWIEANSSATTNAFWNCLFCFAPCIRAFEVNKGHLLPFEDGEGGFKVAGEGAHCHCSPFWKMSQSEHDYSRGYLQHGDWGIAIIEQGQVGLAFDKGQPVLLPPGLHHWQSRTLRFQKSIDLSDDVIYLGPYTLLTVDEGYSAVTQNNGKQEIKSGGAVHLLTHRNHKFERMMSTKMQTNDLQEIDVLTADNVLLRISSTVNWKIVDVAMAAVNAADTQNQTGGKLKRDVLKQATASLAAFVGTMRFSDSISPQSQVQAGAMSNELFDTNKLIECVSHSNAVTQAYGVEITSVNIISAKPVSRTLGNQLSKGAVAAADAQQLETAATGEAKAKIISVKAKAESSLVASKTRGEVIRMQAKALSNSKEESARGTLNAAKLIEKSNVATDLTRIQRTGNAIVGSNVFFDSSAN